VDSLSPDADFNYPLSRAKFEELIDDLLAKTTPLVDKVLVEAKVERRGVDEIVLVGGSTRIPKVQELLRDFFNGKSLSTSVNPDEAVANGAAVQGAILAGVDAPAINEIVLLDVISHTLGVEVKGGIMSNIIDKNTSIPSRKARIYTTSSDDQSSVNIQVYEGDSDKTEKNHFLGNFTLTDITPGPRGTPKIEVTFEVDENSILHVTAQDIQIGLPKKVKIETQKGGLPPEEVSRLKKEFEMVHIANAAELASRKAKNEFDQACSNLKKRAESLPSDKRKAVEAIVAEFSKWSLSSSIGCTAEDFKKKEDDLENTCCDYLY